MTSMEDIERRLARVEDTVASMRERSAQTQADVNVAVSQASDARRLASGASADVTDVEQAQRGTNRVIEALRETQLEQGERIDQNFAEVKSDIAELKVGLTQIVSMLEGLSGRE